jgi:CH-like domain in sperm protein
MHAYDNGTATAVKKANWTQLLKQLRKVGLGEVIPAEVVNAVVHCEDGAIIALMNRLYEVLTQRKVQEVVRRPLPDAPPPYARGTGIQMVRSVLKVQ